MDQKNPLDAMHDAVIAELEARKGDLRKVAADTGIPYDTVLRIKNRENNSAIGRVSALYSYLFAVSAQQEV